MNLRQLAQSDVPQGIIVKANAVAIYDLLMSFALVSSMPLALPFNVDVSLHVQPPQTQTQCATHTYGASATRTVESRSSSVSDQSGDLKFEARAGRGENKDDMAQELKRNTETKHAYCNFVAAEFISSTLRAKSNKTSNHRLRVEYT